MSGCPCFPTFTRSDDAAEGLFHHGGRNAVGGHLAGSYGIPVMRGAVGALWPPAQPMIEFAGSEFLAYLLGNLDDVHLT